MKLKRFNTPIKIIVLIFLSLYLASCATTQSVSNIGTELESTADVYAKKQKLQWDDSFRC